MKKGPSELKQTPGTAGSQKAYILTWLALICLTAATVAVYFMHLGDAGAAIALTIASIKAGLILLFFMHLRQESRLLQGIFLMPLLLVWLIIGLTVLDVFYR
jgi:cytochrome c oxidase subunit 4